MPSAVLERKGGTTKTICVLLTDLRPHAMPLIDIERPLSSSGRLNLRVNEPTAVLEVIGCAVSNERIANIPGDIPVTWAGVIGVGLGLGVGVGVGEGCCVGLGVGETDGAIGKAVAPVTRLTFAVP